MPESTPIEKHDQIKVWNAEDWLYEDFEIGRKDDVEGGAAFAGKMLGRGGPG